MGTESVGSVGSVGSVETEEELLDQIAQLQQELNELMSEREDMRQALRDCITTESDRARRSLDFCRRRFDYINRIAMDTLSEGERWT